MVGRTEEIAELKAIAEGDRSCLVVVYGRRRIGKTFLVREAFNCSFAFSHTGMEKGTMAEQLRQFRESFVDYGWTDCPAPSSWISSLEIAGGVITALLPVYTKLLRKINTSIIVEDNGKMGEIDISGED